MNGQLARRLLGILALALAVAVVCTANAADNDASPCGKERQCYPGDWRQPQHKAYYYRRYYFKSSVKNKEYKYHYVIYYPGEDWMYYYDPVARTYWCRAYRDVNDKHGQHWIVLPRGPVRKALLGEIPAAAWEKRRREIPLIPGSQATGDPSDEADMLAPPPAPKAG